MEPENNAPEENAASNVAGAAMGKINAVDGGIGGMFVKYVLKFEEFVANKIILVIYYIGLVGVVISSSGAALAAGGFFSGLFTFILALILGTLFWRVMCELFMLSFKIYDRLGEIRDELKKANDG